jgi:hypothetical protein
MGVDVIQQLLGEYGWMFLGGATLLFFKSTIESSIAGLIIFLGSDYNADDVVILDGRPGRIVRITPWTTTFYLYTITGEGEERRVSGGTKISVDNHKLKDLKIEKPLANIDLDGIYANQ